MLDVTSRDALDQWHIDVRLGATQRRAVRLQEEAGHKERGALVAIRQRVVARQALQQDRRLLQDRWIDLHIAKAGARRRERRLSETNVGKAHDLLRRGAENIRRNVAEVPELGVVDRHDLLLAKAAQRLAVLLGEAAALLGALAIGAGKTACEIRTLGRRRCRLRRRSLFRSRVAHGPIVARRARASKKTLRQVIEQGEATIGTLSRSAGSELWAHRRTLPQA